MSALLLQVDRLAVRYATDDGSVQAVRDVSFDLRAGEALGLVGESGSGKSVTALSVMGLHPRVGCEVDGTIAYRGRDLVGLADRELRAVRGREIAMVYQDPMTALNPALTIGRQLTGVIRHHLGLGRRAARERAAELLAEVGIAGAERRLDEYPHQFSGGQRQRILIALALSCDPSLLIADEPTTALDVTIQAQILELVQRLRAERDMAILWITHDLGVVAGLVDRVAVMYAGRVVEQGPVTDVFARPSHPYTAGLLRSLPAFEDERRRLTAVPGQPPDPRTAPDGCPFAPRCELADDRCRREAPAMTSVGGAHAAACWRAGERMEAVL